MGKPQTTIAVVILAIVAIASGEYAMVIGHYLAQFDGVVVTRTDDVHFPPWTRNRANRYVIRESDGSEHIYYADSAEGRNGFPIGTRIAKQRWRMGYKENGQARSDFPLDIYILPMMIDAVLLLGCVVIASRMARSNRAREQEAAYERAKSRLDVEGHSLKASRRANSPGKSLHV